MSNWRGAVFLSWAGMRGALSLAAALALPLETDAGAPFPGRDLILFLTFSVILATLVGQGLTLPFVIRMLGLEDDGIEDARGGEGPHPRGRGSARQARRARDGGVGARGHGRAHARPYRFRAIASEHASRTATTAPSRSRSQDYQRLRRELLDAERQAIVDLRRTGAISNDVWIRVARDLDLEDERLDI